MTTRAVDIVILPPEEVMKTIVAIDNANPEPGHGDLALIMQNRLPHLSLLMGALDEGQTNGVKRLLGDIAKDTPSFDLIVSGFSSTPSGKWAGIDIEVSTPLRELQNRIVNSIAPLLHTNVTEEHYADDILLGGEINWVKTFIEKMTGDNMHPHITMRKQLAEPANIPASFPLTTLALCHLGKRNTCVEIIAQFDIQP